MRVALLLLAGLLVACSGIEIKPGEVSHARREMPPGPGLLSGSDGEFVIFRQGREPVVDDTANEENRTDEPAEP